MKFQPQGFQLANLARDEGLGASKNLEASSKLSKPKMGNKHTWRAQNSGELYAAYESSIINLLTTLVKFQMS